MTMQEDGEDPRRSAVEERDAAEDPLGHDPTLRALESLVSAAEQVSQMTGHVITRAAFIRARRMEGLPYRDIVSSEGVPLIAELLTENIQRLEAAGTRFRQAEARALHDEGLTLEEIGRLFRLTRQRISALLRSPSAPPPNPASEQDDSGPNG